MSFSTSSSGSSNDGSSESKRSYLDRSDAQAEDDLSENTSSCSPARKVSILYIAY